MFGGEREPEPSENLIGIDHRAIRKGGLTGLTKRVETREVVAEVIISLVHFYVSLVGSRISPKRPGEVASNSTISAKILLKERV